MQIKQRETSDKLINKISKISKVSQVKNQQIQWDLSQIVLGEIEGGEIV